MIKLNEVRKAARGFSLIEMMMVLGVGGIVTYGIVTMMRNTSKSAQSLGGKNDFNQFANEFGALFGNADRCRAAFDTTNTSSSVPPLSNLGDFTDPATKPIPIALNLGNANVAKGALGPAYKAGYKWGNSLTIIKLELTGKKKIITDVTRDRPMFTIPVHLVVSRRAGVQVSTTTATATSTGSGTSTSTSTGLVTNIENAAGSETASGGDYLERTFNLTATLDSAENKVVGCFGQYNDYWTNAQVSTATATGTASSTVTHTSLDIVYRVGNVVIWPATEGYTLASSTSAFTDTRIYTDTRFVTAVRDPGFLSVGGTVQSKGFTYRSDRRLKTNVREIPGAIERLLALHGVEFDWKHGASADDKDRLGLLAQEVEKVFPEAVTTDRVTGYKAVAYEALLPVFVEALKARQAVIVRQQRELEELRKQLTRANP